MKALVGAFNQEKALVGAFSVIVKTGCGTDGALHSTEDYNPNDQPRLCLYLIHISLCASLSSRAGGRERLQISARCASYSSRASSVDTWGAPPTPPTATPLMSRLGPGAGHWYRSVFPGSHWSLATAVTTGDWGGGVLMTKTDR